MVYIPAHLDPETGKARRPERSSAAPCYIASERLEEFKRQTTLQVKLNGMVAASTSLEMLLYIANLERKLIECGIDIEAL